MKIRFLTAILFALALSAPVLAAGHTPVTICHHAGPNPANWHTITVDDNSVTLVAHLKHGDTLGPCEVPTQFGTEPTPEPTPRPTPTTGSVQPPAIEAPLATLPPTDTE